MCRWEHQFHFISTREISSFKDETYQSSCTWKDHFWLDINFFRFNLNGAYCSLAGLFNWKISSDGGMSCQNTRFAGTGEYLILMSKMSVNPVLTREGNSSFCVTEHPPFWTSKIIVWEYERRIHNESKKLWGNFFRSHLVVQWSGICQCYPWELKSSPEVASENLLDSFPRENLYEVPFLHFCLLSSNNKYISVILFLMVWDLYL